MTCYRISLSLRTFHIIATDIRASGLEELVDVATYLFTYLNQLGIDSFHGVLDDLNLVALDYLDPCGLKWAGNSNELNGGYAADGYARVKGLLAVVTTFGMGELSFLNTIAAASAEYIPIVHITTSPSTISQRDGMLLHHTLGNGDCNVFASISANISVSVAKLVDPAQVATQIDHTLRECYLPVSCAKFKTIMRLD